MNNPVDNKLYESVKKEIYKNYPKHSAYRSGHLVKTYKKRFKSKYGSKSPYSGKKTQKQGLKRWFDEKWVNQRGKVGYQYKNDIYRPSKRITKKTPKTLGELSRSDLKKARREKYTKGRVKKFGGKWTRKYKVSINCNKPRGFSQKQYCKYGRKQLGGKVKKFKEYPNFTPNLTPRDIFKLGSFGGTYWRPIYSKITRKHYKNPHKKYPKSWWKGIPESDLSNPDCDVSKNKYGVAVGTSLDFWEKKKWIKKDAPYGWVQWYCNFYQGKKSDDDERQVKRWEALAGPRGRFMRFLVTQILKKGAKWNDETVSPKIRQVLQHWGYKLTKKDFDREVKRRNQ